MKWIYPPLSLLCVATLHAKPLTQESLGNTAKNFMYLATGTEKHVKKIHKESEFFPDIKEFTAKLIASDENLTTMLESTKNNKLIADIKHMDKTNKKIESLVNFVELESGGWMLVAADDVSRPILGYSLDGTLDLSDIPIQLKELIALRRLDIKSAKKIKNHITPKWINEKWTYWNRNPFEFAQENAPAINVNSRLRSTSNGHTIIVDHLMQSVWGQESPYNNQTPVQYSNGFIHTLTGCVATAVAQIMRYWEHPSCGTGYERWQISNNNYQVINFSSACFDWNDMDYGPHAVDVNGEIAELMWYVGVASHMNYGVTASSAYTSVAVNGLHEHFYYKGGHEYSRSNYSDAVWYSMLRNEIDNERPVLYRGCGGGCHAFVIDGYGTEDSFGVNFGWDSNSWVTFLVLDSSDPNYAFVSSQRAYPGLEPK